MFIINRKLFNEYCEWLFSILFEVEKLTNIENYDDYNKRIFGFLAERFFNVWVKEKHLKAAMYSVINIEDEEKNKKRNISSKLLKFRCISVQISHIAGIIVFPTICRHKSVSVVHQIIFH